MRPCAQDESGLSIGRFDMHRTDNVLYTAFFLANPFVFCLHTRSTKLNDNSSDRVIVKTF